MEAEIMSIEFTPSELSTTIREVLKDHQREGLNMIGNARRGRAVVRLKSGDPAVFGRLGEELDALREAEVPFEIVPGVTAATAAAAAAQATLTDRRLASALVVLTGHRHDGAQDESF